MNAIDNNQMTEFTNVVDESGNPFAAVKTVLTEQEKAEMEKLGWVLHSVPGYFGYPSRYPDFWGKYDTNQNWFLRLFASPFAYKGSFIWEHDLKMVRLNIALWKFLHTEIRPIYNYE